jgi:flagellar hook-associated protein 2
MNALALTGRATNAGVQFLSASENTNLDGDAYAVDITQVATQAHLTAGVAQSGALTADETLTINGTEVTLTAGMTLDDVLETINALSSSTGVTALRTLADGTGTGDYLTLRANNYGSAATISAVSDLSNSGSDTSGIGNVAATLTSPTGESGAGSGAAGVNVAGTINGEAATGAGQVLTGNDDNLTTEGLRLRITGTATGSRGTVTLSNGFANAAFNMLTRITDIVDGPIFGEQQSLETRIDDLQKTIDKSEEAAKRTEESLRLKFARLEVSLQQFQSQSDYIGSQISSWNKSK